MKNEIKNKRLYKIISCVAVFFVCVFAFVGLALSSSQKVKAGVIIDSSYSPTPQTADDYINANNYTTMYLGLNYVNLSPNYTSGIWGQNVATVYSNTSVVGYIQLRAIDGIVGQYPAVSDGQVRVNLIYNKTASSSLIPTLSASYYIADIITLNGDTYFVVDIQTMLEHFNTNDANFNVRWSSYSRFFTRQNTISSVSNIYDLQQNDVAIIYISDVSGFNNTSYQPEITINWGYIDSTDNTIYAAYAPTVNVMKAPGDLEIWLNIPTDASGTVYDSVILNQQALLTTISEGGATANANIYAIYVWLLSDRIQWGLLNFNTAGLPASAMSMNYFTSYTTKYDYINSNTGTMTCRLSISNNFNFITIKNQPVFSVNTINTTMRQGGLMPAWALYNWARGSAAGYTSGTQAGAAPYQPGGTGYNEIFQAGYNRGLEAQPAAAWYEAAFAAVDAFLNIHIFPSITFGELFGIPFVITVVWFIIRMFRGGGSG